MEHNSAKKPAVSSVLDQFEAMVHSEQDFLYAIQSGDQEKIGFLKEANQILEKLYIARDAAKKFLCVLQSDDKAEAGIVDHVSQSIDDVYSVMEPLFDRLNHVYIKQLLNNARCALEEVKQALAQGNREQAAMKAEYQLIPVLWQAGESFYFWCFVYPDRERRERYWNEEFAAHYTMPHISTGKKPKYRVSLTVVAYNNLDVTKRCVESILKYTDFEKLNVELVLVDNGSTDGTLEYFESLGVGRVIHFSENMIGITFCILPQLCDCEYYVSVANDTAVTKDWLDILLTCMESDPKIAAAAPFCFYSDLNQPVNIGSPDCETLTRLAEEHNRCNPQLWMESASMGVYIWVVRMQAIRKIGFWDPYFYLFSVIDIDYSIRLRRNGYRQIFCGDVYCYHQGSATIGRGERNKALIEKAFHMCEVKHGLDSWYDYSKRLISNLRCTGTGKAHVLGIDCRCGNDVFALSYLLQRYGRESEKYVISTQKKFYPDLLNLFQNTAFIEEDNLVESLETAFSDQKFDVICIRTNLAQYFNPLELIKAAAHRLRDDGQLLFYCENPYYVKRLKAALSFSLDSKSVFQLTPDVLEKQLRIWFDEITITGTPKDEKDLVAFICQHYGKEYEDTNLRKQLSIPNYYFGCIKRKN